MKLSVAKAPFTEAFWDKFFPAVRNGIEKADFDSGWIPTPTDKVIKHNLTRLPSEVWVYASANASGDSFASDTWTACTASQITITGPQAYCRVRMNLGG